MVTLDDRILGEKLHYYCSSSEDEDEEEKAPANSDQDDSDDEGAGVQGPSVDCASQELRPWEGTSSNTGPKGVLQDWRNFKKMEAEKRKEKEKERSQLAKKLTMTCRSHLDEEKAKAAAAAKEEQDEVDSLLDSGVLEAYIAQRMQEMMQQAMANSGQLFGRVVSLSTSEEFLEAVDEESEKVTVIVHIYRRDALGCEAMAGCLACLASDYKHIKFCELSAATAGLSNRFAVSGVPALLVYRAGTLLSNFVRITDKLGEDFYATDVESFLVEHGMLPDRTLVPQSCIRSSSAADDDSDVSIDN